MSDWIKCTDRMPPAGESVLVGANGLRTREMAYFLCGEWASPRGIEEDAGITHWMPLPEPPEE